MWSWGREGKDTNQTECRPPFANPATITDWSTAPAPTGDAWTDDGQLATITRPTGTGTAAEDIISTYGYDTAGRLTGISHEQNSIYLAEFWYDLDANGNREQVTITDSALTSGVGIGAGWFVNGEAVWTGVLEASDVPSFIKDAFP